MMPEIVVLLQAGARIWLDCLASNVHGTRQPAICPSCGARFSRKAFTPPNPLDPDSALAEFSTALHIAEDIRARADLAHCHAAFARFYHRRAKPQQAEH